MAPRNVAKAVGVWLLLLALFWLLICAQPQPSLRACTGDPPKPAAPEMSKASPSQEPDIPLELRMKIDPRVLKAFLSGSQSLDGRSERQRQARYIVHLTPRADLSTHVHAADLAQRRQAVVESLRRAADESQAALVTFLESQRASGAVREFTEYWVFNGLAVTSDLQTLLDIAVRPEVGTIREDRVHHLPPVGESKATSTCQAIEWNISQVEADRVWSAYGLQGDGVVVATLDSGVDWTHPALQRKYRGYDPTDPDQAQHDYNWFDATQTYPDAPQDGDGHGTHTMGTLVGSLPDGPNQVGVAPGAQWIAAKVFDDAGETLDSWLHAGFQWILAPTDRNGQNADPAKAPDICNNSWGDSDGDETTFWDDVLALRAAGIFPVFAVGNKYQGSLAAHAPGTFPQAVAVGATDRNDVVASWSCRGPSPWNEIKPEIAAPGAGVRSTFPGNQYAVLDGTSMAVPHVAGVAALLWEAYEEYGTIHSLSSSQLDVSAMERIITQTAHPLPDAEAVPNNDYGWGRIDAYQAVGAIAQGGDFLGRVTDVGTGQGVSGATVVMLNRDFGGTSRAGTDPQGYYTFAVAAGLYDVTAAQFYYAPRSATAVEILAQTTTQLDFRLTPLPAGQVLGRVVDVATGQPVEATVREIDRLAHVTTDASGYYTLTLPLGRHVLEAVPLVAGHSLARVTVTLDSEGQTTVQGFFLDAIPKVLLVDADAWVSGGTVAHYQRSLEALSYSFDMWTVSDRSSSGIGSFPPAETMQDYDLVIWAQPLSSPGYIGAWPALASYLDLGKTLLISGQDIGFWDVQREFGADDYEAYLHASYERDDAGIQEVVGLPGTFLGGLSLTLGTPDSAQNQDAPSEIAPSDGLAVPVLDYVGDGHAALAIDECEGHRAAYLSFGLEGSGPEGARTQVLGRVLQWLAEPRPDYGLSLAVPRQWATGEPAGQARFAVSVLNTGLKADSYRLSVVGNRWSATTLDTTGRNGVTSTVVVSPCSSLDLTLVVDVAGSAVTGQSDAMTLSVRSQAAPAVVQERVIEVTASMPWTSVPPLPTARYRAAAAAVAECQFFVIGGWSDDELATQTNDMYDVRTGSWQAMAAKPTATANTAAAVIGGSVYVPGGLQGDTRIKALEIYEPDADRWVQGADLPQAVASSAVASANGKLYVFGGSDADGTLLDTTLEYDPATDDWSTRTPLPSGPRAYAAAAELGGKLYVAGGWPSLRNLECYDPVADSWTALAPLPTGRHSLGLVVLEGAVYAVGGGDSWTGLAAVERYDPPTDSWVTLTPLSSAARAGAAVSAVAGRLHVVGGTDEDNGTVSAHEALAVGASLGDSSLMADRKVIAAGQETTFVITLRNPGQQAIHQALFYDDIPVHATYVTGSVAGGATYNPSANRVEWQGPMAARSSKVLQFQVKLPEELPRGTLITNTAWVDDGLCGGQPISALVTIEAADLSASHKAVDRATARGGEELLYSIDLRNVGAFTSSVVRLEDPVPGELAYVPGSVVGGTYNDGLDQIEWSGVLPPGAEGSYRWLDSNTGGVVYEWLNATDGIAVPDGGDDVALGPFDIGFPFAFYGQEYTEFYLNTNGQVLFGAGSLAYSNVPIPNPSTPNNFLAAFWDDLVSEEGTLFYKLVGSAPARRLVIEWEGVRRYSVESELTFEVILHEGSNEVVVQYATLEGASADGESATVGIEDGSGGEGVEYQYNDEGPGYPLHPGLAVLFAPVARHYVAFRATLPRDIPLGTQVSNEALLTHDEGPPLVLTATTRVGLTELPHAKTVDKLVAISGEELSYFIQLSNVDIVTPTQAQVVDPLPANLTYVPGSVVGGTYNDGLDQIEWSGVLPPGAEGTYRWFDSDTGGVVYEWLDATDGIKVPEGGDDRALGPFDIGFPFTFYGVEHTEFYLNTNGQVLFGTGSLAYSNVRIPNSSPPNNFVAAFWDDLVSEEGTLFHKLVGSAPARRLVIEWEGVRRYSGDTRLTFEVILREGSDEVVVQYAILEGASADGESATVGLEDGSGGEGVEYQYNDVGPGYPLHPGLAVLFTPAPKGHEVSFRARVAGDLPVNTLITNEALAGLGDQAPLSLTATTWVNQVDLSTSSLGVDHTEAPVGELLTYDIRLHNSGNVAAAHVSLVNPIPRGTQYVDGSVAGGATYDPGSERVTWGGSVPPRLSVPISFAVKTSQAAPHNTPITNVVAIDAGQGSWITRTVVTVLQSFDLNASDKVMPPRAGPGEVIGCSVRLRNMGAISASAVLTDTLPTGMTLVPGSLWASSAQAHSEAGAIVWHGEIVARGMVIVRFLALVDPAIEVGTSLVNTARIKDSLDHAYERTSRTLVYDPAATVFLPIVRK